MAPAEHDALRAPAEPAAQRAPAEPAAQRARRVDVFVALGTAVVALGLLLGLPPLDSLEPDAAALASGSRHRSPWPGASWPSACWPSRPPCSPPVGHRAPYSSSSPPCRCWSRRSPRSRPTCSASPHCPWSSPSSSPHSGSRWPACGRRSWSPAALVAAGSAVLYAVAGGAFRGDFSAGLAGSPGRACCRRSVRSACPCWSPCWCGPAARSAPPAPPRPAPSTVSRTPWSTPRCPANAPRWPASSTTSPRTTCPASP